MAGCSGRGGEPETQVAKTVALTDAQVQAARAAGLIPGTYLQPRLFEPLANFSFDPTTMQSVAYRINNSGQIAGFSQTNGSPPSPNGCAGSPFFVDTSGTQSMLPNPSGVIAYAVDVNQNGDVVGFGGQPPSDFLRPVVYHPDGTYQLLTMPVPPWIGAPVRMWTWSLNNVYGTEGLPTIAGSAVYLRGGALGVWHLDGDGTDAVGPSTFATPANAQWIPGHTGSALQMNGDVCLSLPGDADTYPFAGAGVTIMAWVKPAAAMCPGGLRKVLSRNPTFDLSLGCNADGSAATVTGGVQFRGIGSPPAGSVPFGEWSHIAITWDYRWIRAYVNGVQVGQSTGGPVPASANALSIGCQPGVPGSQFIGAVDEVAAFDVAMGPDQIEHFHRDMTSYQPSIIRHFWGRMKDGSFDEIMPPGDARYVGSGMVADLDDHGRMVGWQSLVAGGNAAMLYDPDPGAGWTNLNDLVRPEEGWNLTGAAGITNNGFVIGSGEHDGRHAAYRLDLAAHAIADLGRKTEYPYGVQNLYVLPNDVNAKGHVVGAQYDLWPFWALRAFVYTDELGFLDLNSLIDPAFGWELREARGINDSDDIVGVAYSPTLNEFRAFKLSIASVLPLPDDCVGPICAMPAHIRALARVQVDDAVVDPIWKTAYQRIDAKYGLAAARAAIVSSCGFDPLVNFDSCLIGFDNLDAVLSGNPADFVALCRGHWNRTRLDACLRAPRSGSAGGTAFQRGGVDVLGGDGRPFFALLSDDTLALGSRAYISEAIDRFGWPMQSLPPGASRPEVARLAGWADGRSTVWLAALVDDGSVAASGALATATGLTGALDMRTGLQTNFRFEARTPEDAAAISASLMTMKNGARFPALLNTLGLSTFVDTPVVSGSVVTTTGVRTAAELQPSIDLVFPPGGVQ